MTLLDPIDGLPVHARQLGELLLREPRLQTSGPNVVTNGPAASKDPIGWRSRQRHPTTLTGS